MVGNFRTTNIKFVSGIKEEYNWVPTPIIWLYSYTYFNVLNLDNLIVGGKYPLLNGSSLEGLIPARLRKINNENVVPYENPAFTVRSYLFPVTQDIGLAGALIFTMAISIVSWNRYVKARRIKTFSNLAIYSVLSYCLLFSFFNNNWVYLPVIFQIPIILFLSRFVIREKWIQEHIQREL
jgi:hypothetical protein